MQLRKYFTIFLEFCGKVVFLSIAYPSVDDDVAIYFTIYFALYIIVHMAAIKGKPVFSRQKRIILKCSICASEYVQHQYRANSSKFCSKECWSTRNPVPEKICQYCQIIFWTRNRNQKFCCRSCATKPRKGNKSGAWKGGISLKNERARSGNDLKIWRESVFKRDCFKCQRCSAQGKLHAHHIKSFSEFPNLRFDISNGETLCISCHEIEHNRNFRIKRVKFCKNCGIATKGRSKMNLCASCAIIHWHSNKHLD